MDNNEFQRLVLVALAEIITIMGDAQYGGPSAGLLTHHRAVVHDLHVAAMEGDDA